MGQLSSFNDEGDEEEEEAVEGELLVSISSLRVSEPADSATAKTVCSNILGGLTGILASIGALHSGQLELL